MWKWVAGIGAGLVLIYLARRPKISLGDATTLFPGMKLRLKEPVVEHKGGFSPLLPKGTVRAVSPEEKKARDVIDTVRDLADRPTKIGEADKFCAPGSAFVDFDACDMYCARVRDHTGRPQYLGGKCVTEGDKPVCSCCVRV